MNLFIFVIIIFFSSLGLLYFFNFLQYFMFNTKHSCTKSYGFILVPIAGHLEDVEFLIRKYLLKNKNIMQYEDVIFLDVGLDYETKKILNKIYKSYNFTLCENTEIYDILKNKIEKIYK